MIVVMISLDSGLLDENQQLGDSRQRHIRYAEALVKRFPTAHLHIIVRGGETAVPQTPSPHLTLHPTPTALHQFYRASHAICSQIQHTTAIDLVTTQSPFLDGGLGVWLRRKHNAALLIQLHLSNLANRQWQQESWKNRLRFWLARWVLGQATAVRVVTPSTQAWLTKSLGIPPERICVLPVTAVSLQPQPDIKKTFPPTILYVGRLSAEKDVAMLINAFDLLKKSGTNAHLHIVGDGPEMASLPTLAARLGLEEAITFHGGIPPNQLAAHYQRATVLALPSRHESFGRVIIEAFTLGLPVVATATEGATTLIIEGKNGFLTPVGAPNRMAEKLRLVLEEPQLAKQMGQVGRQTAVPYTNLSQQTDALIDCWATAVQQKT